MQGSINQLYSLTGDDFSEDNPWAVQLWDMTAVQNKLTQQDNPFTRIYNAMMAEADLDNTTLESYMSRFVDALNTANGTNDFVSFWSTLGAKARS